MAASRILSRSLRWLQRLASLAWGGFAFHGVLANIIAGLSIVFTRPYRVGEYIELLGVQGQVLTIELFSTTLAQLDQSRLVIPNHKIVGEILHNYGTIRQLQLKVGVAYGANLSEVLVVAKQVVAADPRVLKEPAAWIGISELADSSVTLSIQPWVVIADMITARAALYQAIVERFRASKIEIPFPVREVRRFGAWGNLSSTLASLWHQQPCARVSGHTSRAAAQNPSAPSPTATTGAASPRRLRSRNNVFQLSALAPSASWQN